MQNLLVEIDGVMMRKLFFPAGRQIARLMEVRSAGLLLLTLAAGLRMLVFALEYFRDAGALHLVASGALILATANLIWVHANGKAQVNDLLCCQPDPMWSCIRLILAIQTLIFMLAVIWHVATATVLPHMIAAAFFWVFFCAGAYLLACLRCSPAVINGACS